MKMELFMVDGFKIPIFLPAGGELIRPLLEKVMAMLLTCFIVSACGQTTRPATIETEPTNSAKEYELLFELNVEAVDFTVDKLLNIYYYNKKSEVVKLAPDGTEQFRYINKTLGLPSQIDATNPFNLLVFYADYQVVATLDRTMNLAGRFNLFDLGLFGVEALGMASDGNLWVYDAVNFRLKKLGKEGETIVQSGNLGLELDRSLQPKNLIERGQLVYLNDPAIGLLVFDIFGKYLKTLPIIGVEQYQVVGDQLLYFKAGNMESFHLKTLLVSPIILPEGISRKHKIAVVKDRLYVLAGKNLKVYKI